MRHIQQQVDRWVRQFRTPYWKLLEIMTRLTEELGELAREVNHSFGPKRKKLTENQSGIAEESGDIIFTLSCLANSLGIDLDAAFKQTLKKYSSRDRNRYARKKP